MYWRVRFDTILSLVGLSKINNEFTKVNKK